MSVQAPGSVSICIATFRRPGGLRRVVKGLERLSFGGAAPPVEIVVVDNDPEGSAEEVVRSLAEESRWPIRYVHEPRRGLSQVRNTAVAAARERSELVAFIDDDEEPTPPWLDELLRVRAAHDADVVLGPTLRRFEGPVPAWIERGGFFVEPRHPTGTRLEHGGIGNALIHTRVFADDAPPFDDQMSLAGGEDTLFFLRLTRAGRVIVWADEAVVHEWIPPSRARAKWILQRVYRTSNTWGLCEREFGATPRVVALRIAKGGARIAYGLGMLPFGLLFGRRVAVRSLWYICFGLGNITGLAGLRYQEYRTTHGN